MCCIPGMCRGSLPVKTGGNLLKFVVIVYRVQHDHTQPFGGFMQLYIRGLVALVAMLLSTFAIQTAVAGDVPAVQAPADIYVMAGYTDADGFVVEIPAIDPQLLAEQLNDLRAELLLRRAELVTEVNDLKLDGTDAILTVLLPGGLIYAGYRKHEYEMARNDLVEVNAELDELTRDLSNFNSMLGVVAVRTVE